MNNQEIDFINGLTEQDAEDAISKALVEAERKNKSLYHTYTFKTFKEACNLMRKYVAEGGRLALDQMKFYFYFQKWQMAYPYVWQAHLEKINAVADTGK